VCSAGSRLLIQESVYDDVIARIKQRMSTLRLGHCLDKTIDMGAIIDETQRRSVDEMVQSARAEGAEVCLNHCKPPTCPYNSLNSIKNFKVLKSLHKPKPLNSLKIELWKLTINLIVND